MRDYYAIFDLPRNATEKDIRKRFRDLAKEHNPQRLIGLRNKYRDSGEDDLLRMIDEKIQQETEFMQDLNEANEVLSDPERRRRYDEELDETAAGATDSTWPPGPSATPSSPPEIVIYPARLTFGSLKAGQRRSLSFTIENKSGPARKVDIDWKGPTPKRKPDWGELVIEQDPDTGFPIKVTVVVDTTGIPPGANHEKVMVNVDGEIHHVDVNIEVLSRVVASVPTGAPATPPHPPPGPHPPPPPLQWVPIIIVTVAVVALVLMICGGAGALITVTQPAPASSQSLGKPASGVAIQPASSSTNRTVSEQPVQPSSQSSGPAVATYYSVRSKVSGLCLEIQNAYLGNGGQVWQVICNRNSHQLWEFRQRGSFYEIVAKHSGLCMSAETSDLASHTVQMDCLGRDNQLWELQPSGGYFSLKARQSGLCLDLPQWDRDPGAYILQWTCTGNDNQLWRRE